MSNERNRDFGGSQGRGGGGQGRDPGEDALLELARLIGGNSSDPFAPEAAPEQHPEPRLADVSRAAAAQSYDDRREPQMHGSQDGYDYDDRSQGRGHQGFPSHDEDHFGGFGDEFSEPDDGDIDDGGGERGRRPFRTIGVVLVLAVVATGGVWAWRSMGAANSGDPPLIRADKSPTKITPMSDVKSDSRPGREQVVRRDEDPVDVGSAGADAPDSTPALRSDPRRVRTVPIRADDGSSPPPQAPDRPASRGVAAPPPPPAPAPPRAQPAAAARQAAVAPAPPADAAPSSSDGNYVVQLTAVKTEGDAQREFRRLQNKYSLLGGRQPVIRRKDKGDQTLYAAGVGGFDAKTDAEQFCEQLKAAGGTCYVYKN